MKAIPSISTAVVLLVIAAWAAPIRTSASSTGAIASTMPKGKGKDETVKYCGGCHSMAVVVKQRKTRTQWLETVEVMAQKGTTASEDDLLTVVDYLARNYGPRKSPHPGASSVASKVDKKSESSPKP